MGRWNPWGNVVGVGSVGWGRRWGWLAGLGVEASRQAGQGLLFGTWGLAKALKRVSGLPAWPLCPPASLVPALLLQAPRGGCCAFRLDAPIIALLAVLRPLGQCCLHSAAAACCLLNLHIHFCPRPCPPGTRLPSSSSPAGLSSAIGHVYACFRPRHFLP